MDQQQRVWFLDEARGRSVLLMVLHHGAYDAVFLLGWPLPFLFSGWFGVIRAFFAGVFVLISGCACRLSRNNLRRGARCLLLAAGLSLVTALLIPSQRIRFGVLHLLGVCMLVYPAFKKLPPAMLTVLGLVIAITGYAIRGVVVPQHWLFPLGLTYEGFTSSDYFPLFPQLGYFLIGAAIGKTAYREKRTLLPGAFQQTPVARFFCWCGRQSLFIYLLHQPIVYGLLELVLLLRG